MPDFANDVFLSHSSKDQPVVRAVAERLRADGLRVWFDEWEIKPGDSIPAKIEEGLEGSRVLVLCMSANAFGSDWAQLEAGTFRFRDPLNKERRFIPLRLDDSPTKGSLAQFLYIDWLPETRDGEYAKLLEACRPRRVEQDEGASLFGTPVGMRLTFELRSWIHARWPEGRPDAIFPPWSEFEAGKVTFPTEVLSGVEACFDRSPCALVVGNSGSGKSVLGASIAFRWSRLTGRRAFWLDFGDEVSLSPEEPRGDVKKFLSLSGANLLVLDNSQLAPSVADWAVNQVEALDRVQPGQHRLFILTRPLQAAPFHHVNFHDRLASVRTVLVPNAAIFAEVAVRLKARHNLIPNWTEVQYERWSSEFGGDLIAFGQAVLASGRAGMPTRNMAARRVRETYIDPARRHEKGIAVLDRLCAAATFDLTLDDSSLDGTVQQSLPHLIEQGQLQPLVRGPYRHWKLGHPGLGSLVLEARARDAGVDVAVLRRAALLEVLQSNPTMLLTVMRRVANPTYGGPTELERWTHILHAHPEILEDFLCKAPSYVPEFDRWIPNLIPWYVLRDHFLLDRIVSTCLRKPPHFVAHFLQYAERREPEAAKTILRALLLDNEFRSLLGRTPPHFVAAFLQYCEGHEPKAAKDLLRTLLQNGEFRSLLALTPPHFVAHFLQYAERREPEAAKTILTALLQDGEFRSFLARTPAGEVATFLRYAEGHKDEAQEVRNLLRELLQNGEFRRFLARTAPSDLVTFLRYAEGYKDEADNVKSVLRTLLEDEDFQAILRRTSAEQVASFLEYSHRHEPLAVQTLLQSLLATQQFASTAATTPAGHLARFAVFAVKRAQKEASPWLCNILALPAARPMIRDATLTDLTGLVRAVCSTSEDSARAIAARLIHDWWSGFKLQCCTDGHVLAAFGPILRLAHDLAPEIADEIVSWLNSLDDQFVQAILPVPLGPRLGLAIALRDTERWLTPPLWAALSRAD
jgi:hypothetical protein